MVPAPWSIFRTLFHLIKLKLQPFNNKNPFPLTPTTIILVSFIFEDLFVFLFIYVYVSVWVYVLMLSPKRISGVLLYHIIYSSDVRSLPGPGAWVFPVKLEAKLSNPQWFVLSSPTLELGFTGWTSGLFHRCWDSNFSLDDRVVSTLNHWVIHLSSPLQSAFCH